MKEDPKIVHEAADWLICLSEKEDPRDYGYSGVDERNAAFFAWVKRSHEHLRIFLEFLDLETYIRWLNDEPSNS